jgi:hypothetical protein
MGTGGNPRGRRSQHQIFDFSKEILLFWVKMIADTSQWSLLGSLGSQPAPILTCGIKSPPNLGATFLGLTELHPVTL